MQANAQVTPAPPPIPPTAPTSQAVVVPAQALGGGGVPTTPQELSALRARRSELSNQLESAAGRRNRLAERLKTADPAERPGLMERIGVLDQRMVQLESDIGITGRQLTGAPASLLASTADDKVFGVLNGGMIAGMSIVFTIFVLAPLAFAAARLMWKRATRPVPPPQSPETAQRLERIEQAVDAIAIEVERVSEGQRFVTKLLSEGHPQQALVAGKREEERVIASRE